MEALLRNRPPPDRYLARNTSPSSKATGTPSKFKEKLTKNEKKDRKADKASASVQVEISTPIKAPVVAPSTTAAFEVDGDKSKKSKLSVDQNPSTTMASASSSSSKRKRDGKESSSKSKKKSRQYDVKSRGRSRSKGPSSRSNGKRGRSPSPSSESESQVSEDVVSSDESDSTDSEEEERRKRKMRGRSRSRGPRAQSRGRSRARSVKYDSDSNSSEGEEEEAKVFMAFTVPGGKTHMRPVTSTTSFPSLKEMIYAISNINQKIALELTYVVNGITLQLSDEEDLKSLLELSPTSEMIRVLVEKVEPLKSKPTPKPRTPAKVVATAPSNNGTPIKSIAPPAQVVKPASPMPLSNAEKKKEKREKRQKKKKELKEALLTKDDEAEDDSSEDVPLSKLNSNGKPTIKAAEVGDSTITVEKRNGAPLAEIVLKEGNDSPTKDQVKSDTQAITAKSANEAPDSPVKEKKKRRNRAEMEKFRQEKEAEKMQREKEKEEKKEAKRAAKRAQRAAAKAELKAAEEAKATELGAGQSAEKPAEEAAPLPVSTPAAAPIPTVNPAEETVVPTSKDGEEAAPKKKKSKKNATADESLSKSPVKGADEKAPIDSPKKDSKVSKNNAANAKQSESVSQPSAQEEKETAPSLEKEDSTTQAKNAESAAPTSPTKRKSKNSDCAVCFSKGHSKLYCPIIKEGKESVEKRYQELKGKGRKKTKLENEACKVLEDWIKTNKDHEEEELRFSQNGTLRYRRNPLKTQAKYTSEAERREDEEDQREMTIAMEQERERLQAEANQKVTLSPSKSSPSKDGNSIDDIIQKVNKDKARLGLPVSPRKVAANPRKAKSSSVEIDQLEGSQDTNMGETSKSNGISPSSSESELATSPMLMAKAENRAKANGDVKEVALPAAVEKVSPEAKSAAKTNQSSDTDTSDDSDNDNDEVSDSVEKQDDIQEDSEDGPPGEETESVSQSSSSEDANEKKQSEKDEEDEIEATPVQGKQQNPRSNSWVSGISNILRFGGSSQEDSAAIPNTPIQAPTSAQRPRQMDSTPMATMTPSTQRPRLGGGARLSQLDTSTLKTSFSQPNTPLSNNNNITPFASQPIKRKAVEEALHSESGSESDSNSDDSDSDIDTKNSRVPASKLAGQSKKPRSSLLAKFAK